jgi:hypothetical protein
MPVRIVVSVQLDPSSWQKTSRDFKCRIAFSAAAARAVSSPAHISHPTAHRAQKMRGRP